MNKINDVNNQELSNDLTAQSLIESMKLRITAKWRNLVICIIIILLAVQMIPAQTASPIPSWKTPQITAFIHATIYTSPTDTVIRDGLVIIKNDTIIKVGKYHKSIIPKTADIIDCSGMTITSGFWNSHIHLTDSKIANAKDLSAAELELYLQNFLTKYGFTHAFDIGSFPANTNAIRARIKTGEIKGPFILTTGTPFTPPQGTPFYVREEGLFTTP